MIIIKLICEVQALLYARSCVHSHNPHYGVDAVIFSILQTRKPRLVGLVGFYFEEQSNIAYY